MIFCNRYPLKPHFAFIGAEISINIFRFTESYTETMIPRQLVRLSPINYLARRTPTLSHPSFSSRQSLSTLTLGDILIERPQEGIAHLVLNRDKGKNSFSAKFLGEFCDAVSKLHNDNTIRCVVVKSNVANVFCAGADLKERATMPEDKVEDFVASLRNAFTALENLPVPTIAAIEGVALGGGLELAMACDLRVAGEKAILGLPETSLAIIPGAGGTQRLPRIVGVAKAKELTFLSKRISAQAAASIGLVTESVPAGSAVTRAHELAVTIATAGPIAQRAAKRAITGGIQLSMEKALQFEKECYSQVIKTADRKEGLAAFVEKRTPKYIGK